MGTVVSIAVVGASVDVDAAVDRAFEWFRRVEGVCTRFNPESELMQLSAQVGTPVKASPILFEAVQFALAVAEDTGGAFDFTVGLDMEARGFNREYSTGQRLEPRTGIGSMESGDYRDVDVDPGRKTITLRRPLILDLGAVAKGLAVDAAARELQPFENFAIDAGGDLYLGGCNAAGEPWSVGIRHPRLHDQMIETIRVSDRAVCTSGDYERGPHLLDPRAGGPATHAASVTVVAPTAMVADALATAAFVLGPDEGMQLLERQGVEGLIISPTLQRLRTSGFGHA